MSIFISYVISKWRQKQKALYIIPRVFVLCSPRTIQFQYEVILRVGLASSDFNPEKHDIDLTAFGQTNNEVIPMTRLNTRTLLDEPLITNLSIVVYRLVEMPPLSSLIVRHSGPYKSWVYAYDFTVIDLATSREQYYTLNQYIGSLNRSMHLNKAGAIVQVTYPIDDVPLPQWTIEDVYLFIFATINMIMFSVTWMPIGCSHQTDIIIAVLNAFGSCSIVILLEWFMLFNLRWNQDRKDFFNEYQTPKFFPSENIQRVILIVFATILGTLTMYHTFVVIDWKETTIWLLVISNSSITVFGLCIVARQLDWGPRLVNLGLRLRGVESYEVGLKQSELTSTAQISKSGSNSDDGQSTVSTTSRIGHGFGPRSSVKSFGFDPSGKVMNRFSQHSSAGSRISATGATPNNMAIAVKPSNKPGPRPHEPATNKPQNKERSRSGSRNRSKGRSSGAKNGQQLATK